MAEVQEVEKDAISLILSNLAPYAKDGLRGLVVIGKVSRVRPPSREAAMPMIKADVIIAEGATMTLKFPTNAQIPGVGWEGAFAVANVGEYMNKLSADCLGFM